MLVGGAQGSWGLGVQAILRVNWARPQAWALQGTCQGLGWGPVHRRGWPELPAGVGVGVRDLNLAP